MTRGRKGSVRLFPSNSCFSHPFGALLEARLELQVWPAEPPCYSSRPVVFSRSQATQIARVSCAVSIRRRGLQIPLTTFFTLLSMLACCPAPALQSSARYGAEITTPSFTTILVPSHLVGKVRESPSKISCASLLTDLFLRAASSFIRATAASARLKRAAVSRGVICGRALLNGGGPGDVVERRVKLTIVDIGRIWWVGGVVVDTAIATRLVAGQTVNRVPSSTGWAFSVVSRRMLRSSVVLAHGVDFVNFMSFVDRVIASTLLQRVAEEARTASQRIREELTERRLHRSWQSQPRPGWKHQPVVSQWETSRPHFGVWYRPLAGATLFQFSDMAHSSKRINSAASGFNAQGDHKRKQTEQGKGVTRSKEKRRQEGE